MLVENKKFKGLKKHEGDFKLDKGLITRWKENDPQLYFSGLQIINPKNIFENQSRFFLYEFTLGYFK